MQEINALFSQLESNQQAQIIITTHHKPDADALGSSLGLWKFLRNKGFENIKVISPTDYGDHLKWMPNEEVVVNYERAEKKSAEWIEQADYIFCLDFNDLKRINDMGDLVGASEAKKIMIDHHQEPQGFDDFRLWTTETSSTCELIEDFITMWEDTSAIDADIASCLYAGIMTDTGSFRFDSVKPETHRKVADLIERGAPHAAIHQYIHDSFSLSRMRFIGHCLANKLEVFPEYKTALMHVTREELVEYKIQTGDTEGLVNYGLAVKGVEFSALFIDRTKLVKISFRGNGKFPCNRFAKEHFMGGGHFSAAGGASTDTLEKSLERFKALLPEYKEYLT